MKLYKTEIKRNGLLILMYKVLLKLYSLFHLEMMLALQVIILLQVAGEYDLLQKLLRSCWAARAQVLALAAILGLRSTG
jgi:hypothetical protein